MQDGFLISRLRVENNLKIEEMAKIIKVSPSSYKLYEAGIRNITLEQANTIANYFHITLDYLFNITKNLKSNNFRKTIDYRYLKFCIRFLRKRYHLTQRQLAREFNITIATISKYENKPQTISIDYLIKLSKKFNISSDYLCGKSFKKEVL